LIALLHVKDATMDTIEAPNDVGTETVQKSDTTENAVSPVLSASVPVAIRLMSGLCNANNSCIQM